jgi:hypothetical protein
MSNDDAPGIHVMMYIAAEQIPVRQTLLQYINRSLYFIDFAHFSGTKAIMQPEPVL